MMRISLEEFSIVIAAIHAAAAFPERWPEVRSAVARFLGAADAALDSNQIRRNARAFANDRRMSQAAEPSVRRLIALLQVHFDAAEQIQKKLAEAMAGQLAVAGLDRWAAAAFILDGAGTVHHRNASAQSVLAHASVKNSRLRFNEPRLNRLFEAALRRATQDRPNASILPLPSAGNEICELTVSPLAIDTARLSSCPVRLALVVIAKPQADSERIVRRVRLLYGLTEAEARVMTALTLGATVDEIASEHGVRTSTVRAQVRTIFDKTGVNRQSDLVRLALTGATLVSGPEH
jgi:DNA-binding CsgD family transcriptional regulator